MNKIFSHFCFHVSTKYCSCSFLSSSPIYRRILSASSFRKFIYIIRYINNLFSKCVSSSPFIQISHRQIQFIFDSLVCIPFFLFLYFLRFIIHWGKTCPHSNSQGTSFYESVDHKYTTSNLWTLFTIHSSFLNVDLGQFVRN